MKAQRITFTPITSWICHLNSGIAEELWGHLDNHSHHGPLSPWCQKFRESKKGLGSCLQVGKTMSWAALATAQQ